MWRAVFRNFDTDDDAPSLTAGVDTEVFEGKKIIVGVTGSIAAYKAVLLVRDLVRSGAEVRVAMTDAATRFVGPLTFSSLTAHPVALDMHADPALQQSGSWHIDWALWADAMVIAPATAATIAKLAGGLSDNSLTVIATAMRGPVFVAPAMDHDMYRYPALRRNLATLRADGTTIIPCGTGDLASGLVGPGRLAEPDEIVALLAERLVAPRSLDSRHVLITAGPTREAIDPVRFLSNRSSGKMGYAIAEEAIMRGAEVTLVTGPTSLSLPEGVRGVQVETAAEMATAVEVYREDADIIIAAAAVSDFAVQNAVDEKMKRREMSDADMVIHLAPTTDILASIGQTRRPEQIVVGFALETSNLVENARRKLVEKNCDLVVANPAGVEGAGFESDTNRITLVRRDDEVALPVAEKRECAVAILDAVEQINATRPLADASDESEEVSTDRRPDQEG